MGMVCGATSADLAEYRSVVYLDTNTARVHRAVKAEAHGRGFTDGLVRPGRFGGM